ncbi:hypothetical protein N7466_002829 [Penicillium verhagenii]|uniref:uncharacterized protein n=1 Tax=Penicillium verhagenii TaxID=1562060 RepID=UPI00254550A9|nr:uncharacterized protein N7466_002829 [Penicillium verhagenii]KAJ5939695.1 hypothetical protein N7466_002829 [Penicillium verhagenii]
MARSKSLREACAHPDSLFTLPQDDLLHMIYQDFTSDLDRLKRAYSIRSCQEIPITTNSPSYILYQADYDEVNRTLVGFLALRWIHLGQYDEFVGSQPPDVRLDRQSFEWIRQFYTQAITNPDALYALITSIVINDLGKDPQLASDYQEVTGIDITDLNHDAILLKACTVGLVQSLDKLPAHYKDDLVRGIELGATFNFGQLAQAENVPVCLSGLLAMKYKPSCFQLRFMEQLLDISGAAGHMDSTCAKKLIQPIFDSYRNVYDACQSVIGGLSDLREGYDLVLSRRARFLHGMGFRLLSVDDANDRALMRLFCMGNVTTRDRAEVFQDTWDSLEKSVRDTLVYALNLDGVSGEPAVQPTYMPAFLSRIGGKLPLDCALRYLARVMTLQELFDSSVLVIERSLLSVMKHYVENGEFDRDPTVLEGIDVPEAVVSVTI